MTDSNNDSNSYVHYPLVSWRTRAVDKKLLIVMSGLIIISIPFAYLSFFLNRFIYQSFGPMIMLLCDLVIPIIFAVPTYGAIKYFYNKTLGRTKIKMMKLQEQVVAASIPLTIDEKFELIDCALECKHYEVADFYSKQVLMLSQKESESPTTSNWMVSTNCWASSYIFEKDLLKKLWYAYETRGIFSLGNEKVSLKTDNFSFECRTSQIKRVELKQHAFWIRPYPSKYINLTIEVDGFEHSYVLAPSLTFVETIGNQNRLALQWMKYFERAREK